MQELNQKYEIKIHGSLISSCFCIFQVHFVLGGDDDETQVRTLDDAQRKILQRGGIDAFIMAVPRYHEEVDVLERDRVFCDVDVWDHSTICESGMTIVVMVLLHLGFSSMLSSVIFKR